MIFYSKDELLRMLDEALNDPEAAENETREIVRLCSAALARRNPAVQGAALARLAAMWIDAHSALHETLLELHVAAIREYLKVRH